MEVKRLECAVLGAFTIYKNWKKFEKALKIQIDIQADYDHMSFDYLVEDDEYHSPRITVQCEFLYLLFRDITLCDMVNVLKCDDFLLSVLK